MAYASRSGRARVSQSSPQAFAVCDRCGFIYNHVDLRWQYDWAGASLLNKRFLVCHTCLDTPQQQLRAIVLSPDPLPIVNARPQAFSEDETDYATLTPGTVDTSTGIPVPNTTVMTTVGGSPMVMQPVGSPTGKTQNAQAPIVADVAYGVKLPVVSISSTGGRIITVTCSSPHGLSTNAQVAVQGVTNQTAAGTYSITVTTGTAFTYQTNSNVPSGSVLGSNTLVTTVNLGVPLNFVQIPQTGGV
jgi:hypothetical protein